MMMQSNRRLIYADQAELLIKNYGKGAIADGIRSLDPVDDIVSLARGVELIPTVDAVPVVRCKDCRYRNDLYVIGRAICNNEKGLMSTEIKDTDFCPYGERRVSDV